MAENLLEGEVGIFGRTSQLAAQGHQPILDLFFRPDSQNLLSLQFLELPLIFQKAFEDPALLEHIFHIQDNSSSYLK